MSRRDRRQRKIARLRKELAKRPLPAHLDLIDYLKTRGHARTSGEARRIILDRRVKYESHTLGLRDANVMVGDTLTVQTIVSPLVPADYRSGIYVLAR